MQESKFMFEPMQSISWVSCLVLTWPAMQARVAGGKLTSHVSASDWQRPSLVYFLPDAGGLSIKTFIVLLRRIVLKGLLF